ncbi:MFS transporter [Horticoccus luteus]|uniref:MFS transporter n=1 Tax=Horticoccus luteus TaxID=2862869 RepID=A0A8F9TVH4_9BACT|nr:MFS transporter [Horticoccus luteus]QYM78875.1 MFS transporter [Horticoccus luteus]
MLPLTPTAPLAAPADRPVYRVGTLTYTKLGLGMLFFWLLLGDVVFMLMDQLEPRILPVVLKGHGASDKEIAIIVASIAALFNLIITPVVSYRSDRKRSRWGRRIPYLFWASPFIALFLGLTPYAPEITAWLLRWPAVRSLWVSLPLTSPVVLTYGVLAVLFQGFHMVVASIYFYLFRDVVPEQFLGRFLSLFRIFGSLATFVLNYWLLGMANTHTKEIFVGTAIASGVGFLLMCCFVREGEYPPAETPREKAAGGSGGFVRAAKIFVTESYSAPVYWWTYLARMMIYAALVVQAFLVFFPEQELAMPLDQVGKLSSWASFVWIPLAFPLGWALDRWGPLRTMSLCLIGYIAALAGSFFFVTGPTSFLISTLCTGSFFPMLMLSQSMLAQRIFHPLRMGQLSSANAMIQSLVIAAVIGPATGWLFDALHGFSHTLHVPWVGAVILGPYRFVFIVLIVLSSLSLVGTRMANRHWLKLGGPAHYTPPL